MTTATVWLLIALATSRTPTTVVERFPTLEECQRVLAIVHKGAASLEVKHQCVQATIVITRP